MVHMEKRWYVRRALALLIVLVFGAALPQASPTALAQTPDLSLTPSGPSYVVPGGTITYELELRNLTDQPLTNITVYDPLPANTTYVSGGTFNAGQQRAEFTLASLAPRAVQGFTLVVSVGSGIAVGTSIENKSLSVDYTIGGDGFNQTVSRGVVTRVEAPGGLLSIYTNAQGRSFDVKVDGYRFENYGATSWTSDDLGVDDLLLMFGPQVCVSGTTVADCKLSQPADDWRKKMIEYMNGGHCDGLAMTSLRFFNQQPFKNKTVPSNYQAAAQRTNDLTIPEQPIENYNAYYWTTQLLAGNRIIDAPIALANQLTNGFSQNPPLGYAVHIFKLPNFTAGHSVAAYGVESVGPGMARILVYDNNFPNQRQYITINTGSNTWSYETASTPGQPTDVYTGTATSGNLMLSPLADRDLPAGQYFDCPFCSAPALKTQDASALVSGEIQFQYTGEGSILVVNDEGQSTGDDFNTDTFVNTIPGAGVEQVLGGLGKAIPPRIIVPFTEQDETYYTTYVHGKTADAATTGSLMISGAGFTLGVDDLDLDPEEQFEFTLSPDGDYIAFKSTQTIAAPTIYITYDPASDGDPSIGFEISGLTAQAGETISLSLDPALERVYFDSTSVQEEAFPVTMSMVWPDGDTDEYSKTIDMTAGATSAFIDFGAWDGLLDPPTYLNDILENPSINHRLKLTGAVGSYNVTPQANAPAGVYTLRATFTNVTEISLEQVSFTVADLAAGNKLLDAEGGPAGVGAQLMVSPEALGGDGVLSPNESFTLTFRVGLAQAGASGLTVDALGAPLDWVSADPEPTYDANNASFAFAVRSSNSLFLPAVRK